MGVYHRIVPEMMFQVYWLPGLPIWQSFGLHQDPDPKCLSRLIANCRGNNNSDMLPAPS
jgi:hypothetical protein